MKDSAIEWTDHTFNPWIGCTKVSPGCDHCYAEARARRFGEGELWSGKRRRTKTWREPIVWNRDARMAGTRNRVFCASLADVFDNQVPEAWREDLWELIHVTPALDWLLLTKRPQNIRKMLPPDWGSGWGNVWLGTTVENQEEADRRIPHLQAIPAKVRFLSCEPLLESIKPDLAGIHWVICGGESGPLARHMKPLWAGYLQHQCRMRGIAFFMKQMTRKAPIPPSLMLREFP